MNKLFFLALSIFISFSSLDAQIDISAARAMSEGSTVTIQGIATNGPGLGIIRYIQDDTGAIPAYPGSGSASNFPENVQQGDLVTITGVLKVYNGLLEIDPINSYDVVSSGNAVPDPLVVTPSGVNEANEAMLLKINGITFENGGGVFSVGNYTFTANGEQAEIYVRSNHPIIGTSIPLATVNLSGISSEYNGQYQLLPRGASDVEVADDFYISSPVSQSGIEIDGFSVNWETNNPGTSGVRYGTTIDMENEIDNGGAETNHSVTLTGLDAAEFYYIQAFSDNGNTTINSIQKIMSTSSNSSGDILVYFNHGVDASFSDGNQPYGTTPGALEAAMITRINSAVTSIDVSVYNNNRPTIVAALTNAYNNGIQVRYITDTDTGNLALANPTPPFPIIKGNQEGLMHNKFFVIDAESDDRAWVIMGSTNLTPNNLADDFNNSVFIQDKTIAKAYTIEFEEMWGSSNPTPGIFSVKFGPDKKDNTPHLFNVNGVMIESYFSPTDNTTIEIVEAVNSANDDLQFSILTFTNNELGSAVINAHNNGVDVRGVIDNINDQGGEFDNLINNGVNVTDDNVGFQTHHKYCIIDATNTASDPIVVTGSHNWSASADTRNDENTLIFHDAAVANIFLQEFEARWCEIMNGGNCTTGAEDLNEIEGFSADIYPNPASEVANIKLEIEERSDMTISIWDLNGKHLVSKIQRGLEGEHQLSLSLDGLLSGRYLLTFKVGEKIAVRNLEVVK
jgi:phosphatidylserine/phosphatidylglycerophosphate/cardiolipin synthase-like enzyme/DNA/RNA endonuclease YhcR with UshA esterase domain